MKEISAISTACKNCLFATYDDNTQNGCMLNRIEKIETHPVYELIEAEDEETAIKVAKIQAPRGAKYFEIVK